MTKIDTHSLRKVIGREEFDHPILTSALSDYLAKDQKVNELLRAGDIVRVKKGLYVFGTNTRQQPVCKETLANLIYGPSCISMEYALSHYGLLPERVETVTSITPKRNKEFATPLGRFEYRYLAPSKYPYGIDQVWIDKTHPVLMATAEKALCDYIVLSDIADLKTIKNAQEFLFDYLRADKDALANLDIKQLIYLNRHYQSQKIAKVIEAL